MLLVPPRIGNRPAICLGIFGRLALGVSPLLVMGSSLAADSLDAELGKGIFHRQWVTAPASTDSADGLGPLFNAKSCNGCHKDAGPSRILERDDAWVARGAVALIATPTGQPHPIYGQQIQDHAVAGLGAEGRVEFDFSDVHPMSEGETLSRTQVHVAFADRPNDGSYLMDARIAPSLRGRALMDLVDARAILALADPDDRDGDGISGRVRWIERDGDRAIGRFGSKATGTSLRGQIAEAFALDIGLSSALSPVPHGDCTPLQKECRSMPDGRSPKAQEQELSLSIIDLLFAYLGTLDASFGTDHKNGGHRLARNLGCLGCHVSELPGPTRPQPSPYTDMLLHDLGPQLAAAWSGDGVAAGEWRTAPLVDLDPMSGRRRYLHDGRAATIDEAIRWHGGEAEAARKRYDVLDESDKSALIRYLESL